jgi:DNA (cytosine-5)-methyltransferase 1
MEHVNATTTKLYSSVSLFSGSGGMDLGFHRSGAIRTLCCYEYNKTFVETLTLNRAKLCAGGATGECPTIVQADLSSKSVIDKLMHEWSAADIVYGGPPCQSFSIMGKKGGVEDPRGALIYSFLRVVEGIKPKSFLFENVPHFALINNGGIAASLIRGFEDLGYSVWSGILCAADFGAYTFRRRFFIIGFKGCRPVVPPVPTHSDVGQHDLFSGTKKPWCTCETIFDQIRQAEARGEILLNHDMTKHSPRTSARFEKLAFGETDNVRKRNRLDPRRPAHSVYVGGTTGKLQARSHIHPYLPRELTARECASIQGFPLDWEFAGRTDAVLLQAANAVPVQLAEALACYMVAELDGKYDSSVTGPVRTHPPNNGQLRPPASGD